MPALVDIDGISNKANIAQLKTVDFWKLLDGNPNETSNLISACEHYGFFYLDLSSKGSGDMLDNLDELRALMRNWFQQPLVKKLKTHTISNAHGYKPVGVQSGISEKSKDGWEAMKIGRNELQASAHYILKTLLDAISNGLGMKGDSSLHKYHRDDEPSKSTLYFLHYPATTLENHGVGQNMHTDIGSLTLLFAPQWGLQAMNPDNGEWEWVEPHPGHAVINVGDTLRFLSGRRLRSALHRAVQAEEVDRFSISYFLRASDTVEFTDSDDAATDAKTWYLKKYETYEKPHEVQRNETILTGGMMMELMGTSLTQGN